jgi:O-antigen ligase
MVPDNYDHGQLAQVEQRADRTRGRTTARVDVLRWLDRRAVCGLIMGGASAGGAMDVGIGEYRAAPRAGLYVLCVGIVVSAVVYSFRFQSFLHAKEIVLAGAGPLAAMLAWRVVRDPWALRLFAPLWVYVAAALLIHAVLAPAQLPEEVVTACLRLVLMLTLAVLCACLLIHEGSRTFLENAFMLSAVLVGLLALLQFAGLAEPLLPAVPGYEQRAYSVFGNQNLLGGYMALAVTAILARAGGRARASLPLTAGLAICIMALIVSGTRTAWLATVVGVAMLAMHPPARRGTARLLVWVALPMVLLTAVLAPETSILRLVKTFGGDDHGAWIRLWIWDGSLRMMAENPWIGVGPGNFSYWSPRYMGAALHAYAAFTHHHNEIHTLHAHSELLEIGAEMGLAGLVAIAVFLFSLRRYRGPLWGPLGAFLVFALFNTVSHSMPHMLWFLLLAAMMLRGSAGTTPRKTGTGDKEGRKTDEEGEMMDDGGRIMDKGGGVCGKEGGMAGEKGRPAEAGAGRRMAVAWLVTAGSVAAALFLVWTVYIPSYLLRRAEAGAHPRAYERALEHRWPNTEAAFAYGMALLEQGDDDAAYQHLRAARRGNDTGGLHLALAVLEFERGNWQAARHHTEACLYRWPGNVDAWRLYLHLSEPHAHAAVRQQAARWLHADAL